MWIQLWVTCLLFWQQTSCQSTRRSTQEKQRPNIYRCLETAATSNFNLMEDALTINASLTYEAKVYYFSLKQSIKLPCSGKPNYKIINEISTTTVRFGPKGHLKVVGHKAFGVMYEPDEYCVTGTSSDWQIHYCASRCENYTDIFSNNSIWKYSKKDELCVPKCCPPGMVRDYKAGKCYPTEIEWRPRFYASASVNNDRCVKEVERKRSPVYRYVHHNGGWCKHLLLSYPRTTLYDGSSATSWRLLDNGSVAHEDYSRGALSWKYKWTSMNGFFCLDGVQNFTKCATTGDRYSGKEEHDLLLHCHEEDSSESEEMTQSENEKDKCPSNADVKSCVYIFALFASLVPLGLTLGAYWITWSNQNIHGWTVFSHIASLFILNCFLGTSFVMSSLTPNTCSTDNSTVDSSPVDEGTVEDIDCSTVDNSTVSSMSDRNNGCVLVAYMCHFFFLSTFFWLTVVNFDLWLKFRNLKPRRTSSDALRFLGYAFFAWGGPLLIVVIGGVLDTVYVNNDSNCDDIILPRYGVERCYLDKRAEGVYLYFVIGVLILVNVGFFISLILILYRYKQATATVAASRRKSTAGDITSCGDFIRSELFLKLFVVMGVSFTLEFISWLFESNTDKTENISWLWVVIDFMNILVRAIIIFFIFAWKKQTLVEVRRRCPTSVWNMICRRCVADAEESGAGPGTSGIQMSKMSTHN